MNLKRSLKKVKMFGIIGLLALTSVSCSSSRKLTSSEIDNQGWKVVKVEKAENPAWIISTRNEVGTSFYEYKIEGDIEASPEVCINSYKQDIYNRVSGIRKEGDYEYTTYKIMSESQDTISIYAIHNEPWPLKDTEMSLKYTFYRDTTANAGVKWREAWDEFNVDPNKKLKRIKVFRGSWNFSGSSLNSYKAVYIVQFNLEGQPMWLAQPMVIKMLTMGFNDFRQNVPSQNEPTK